MWLFLRQKSIFNPLMSQNTSKCPNVFQKKSYVTQSDTKFSKCTHWENEKLELFKNSQDIWNITSHFLIAASGDWRRYFCTICRKLIGANFMRRTFFLSLDAWPQSKWRRAARSSVGNFQNGHKGKIYVRFCASAVDARITNFRHKAWCFQKKARKICTSTFPR